MLIFSIDPGANSIGWAVIEATIAQDDSIAADLLDTGVHLFGTEDYRRWTDVALKVSIRRSRRRMRSRRRRLVRKLIEAGLWPTDRERRDAIVNLDPYAIRARGLEQRLDRYEFGRAICHIAKRRGRNDPTVAVKPHGHRSWGEWLSSRRQAKGGKPLPVRNRLTPSADISPNLAPSRQALMYEFDLLWSTQMAFDDGHIHSSLRDELRGIVFGHGATQLSKPARVKPRADRRLIVDPMVRRATRQLGRLFTAMACRYGAPDIVAVEKFGLPSIARRTAMASGRRQRCSQSVCRRLRLLQRQQAAAGGAAFCPYTGAPIDISNALSLRVEIDHILPVSRGGGSDADNLVLCLADANRAKGNRTPYEAFGASCRWNSIVSRAKHLPMTDNVLQRQRLFHNARRTTRLQSRHEHAVRQIVNQVSRIVRSRWPISQLDFVDPMSVARVRQGHGLGNILPHPGEQIGKNRTNHFHHAADAVALSVASLQANFGHAADGMENPVEFDVSALGAQLKRVLEVKAISRRTRRGRSGTMHKHTIYGARDGYGVFRKPVMDLSVREAGQIRDPVLRRQISAILSQSDGDSKRSKLQTFCNETGVRRVRLIHKCADGIVLVDRSTGKKSRLVKPTGNHHLDIVCSRSGQWLAFAATLHDLRQKNWRPVWEKPGCGLKLVMRLHKSDAVEIDDRHGGRVLRNVVRLVASSGHVYLAELSAAGSLSMRHADPADPFRFEIVSAETLRRRHARAVNIDLLGRVAYRRSNVGI